MPDEPWTWDLRANPNVMGILNPSAGDLRWWDRLESAVPDATTGKVLCVCAGFAIAQEVIAAPGAAPPATDAMELLGRWIDEPTDARFARICSLIFGEESPEFDPHGAVWWALRPATSSIGNFEAGWALKGACEAAMEAGLTPERLRSVVERELMSRSRPAVRAAASQV
jgi:hypothetical protein